MFETIGQTKLIVKARIRLGRQSNPSGVAGFCSPCQHFESFDDEEIGACGQEDLEWLSWLASFR
jgi:hypothetical protein